MSSTCLCIKTCSLTRFNLFLLCGLSVCHLSSPGLLSASEYKHRTNIPQEIANFLGNSKGKLNGFIFVF